MFNSIIGKKPVKRKLLGLVLADDFGTKVNLKRQKRDETGDVAMQGLEEDDPELAALREAFKDI
jgi:hypothetical protein